MIDIKNALDRSLKGLGESLMAYECRIYDKNGKLKKILHSNETIERSERIFFNQSSTKKAVRLIKKFKDPKKEIDNKTKFYNKKCMVCGQEFHPRHPNSKYCSHECQKELQLRKNRKNM